MCYLSRIVSELLSPQTVKFIRFAIEDVFTLTIPRLPERLKDVLDNEKLLHFIMTKAGNRFMISLYIGYILYHCNA